MARVFIKVYPRSLLTSRYGTSINIPGYTVQWITCSISVEAMIEFQSRGKFCGFFYFISIDIIAAVSPCCSAQNFVKNQQTQIALKNSIKEIMIFLKAPKLFTVPWRLRYCKRGTSLGSYTLKTVVQFEMWVNYFICTNFYWTKSSGSLCWTQGHEGCSYYFWTKF